jgi:TetR/AcrR family transcriptional regulator, tetracycline repressor protein
MAASTVGGQQQTALATIVHAALQLIDEVGVQGLTMRTLAKALGAPPTSLYAHFSSKEQLLDAMSQELASRLYQDVDDVQWQEALSSLCQRARALFLAHPEWLRLLTRPTVAASVPLRDRLLSQMVGEGMPPSEALKGISGAAFVALGLSLGELAFEDHLPALLEQRAPALTSSAAQERDARFAHATLSLIAGLAVGLRSPLPAR